MGIESCRFFSRSCFIILLIIVQWRSIGAASRWSCNCKDAYSGPNMQSFCLTSGRIIDRHRFCTNFNQFTTNDFPFAASNQQAFLSCGTNLTTTAFMVNFEMSEANGSKKKVLLGAPFARHRLQEAQLYPVCHLSAVSRNGNNSSDDYELSSEMFGPLVDDSNSLLKAFQPFKEEYNQTKFHRLLGECNSTFDTNQLVPWTSPFSVTKLYFEQQRSANKEFAFGQTFIVLATFPKNGSDLKLTVSGVCNRKLICLLTAKSVSAQADFRTRFIIMKDNKVFAEHINFGSTVSKTLDNIDIGNYTCKVEVQYKACRPFADLKDAVYAKVEVMPLKLDNCPTTIEPAEEADDDGLSLLTIVVIATTLVVLITLAYLMIRLWRALHTAELKRPKKPKSSKRSSTVVTLSSSSSKVKSTRAKSKKTEKDRQRVEILVPLAPRKLLKQRIPSSESTKTPSTKTPSSSTGRVTSVGTDSLPRNVSILKSKGGSKKRKDKDTLKSKDDSKKQRDSLKAGLKKLKDSLRLKVASKKLEDSLRLKVASKKLKYSSKSKDSSKKTKRSLTLKVRRKKLKEIPRRPYEMMYKKGKQKVQR